MTDVSLILMPFATLEHPSIALGILKSALLTNDIKAKVYYANVIFAEKLGIKDYLILSNSIDFITAEWIFSREAFPDFQTNDIFSNDLFKQELHTLEIYIKKAIAQTFSFIDNLARLILEDNPAIVGCSSLFHQHCASLAILKRIRELSPCVVTVLGGANCEGSMGYITHKNFAWIDYVVSGEADIVFPDLCKKIIKQGKNIDINELPQGILGPQHRMNEYKDTNIISNRVNNFENIPIPDYDEYFETLNKSSIKKYISPGLLMETSRGCWWGMKKSCTFCSLNGKDNYFRVKSTNRIMEEFDSLSKKYNCTKIETVDNILDMKFFENLIPELINLPDKYQLMFETKSNLKKDQLKMLSDAGVRWIQPGIENLHNEILLKLNKGNNTWVNLQLLKWGLEYGIYLIWNFLIKIPGELDDWYMEMSEWLPLLYHFQPPNILPIRFDRFSEYYRNSEKFGLKLKPSQKYYYVYPLSDEDIEGFAYIFEDHSTHNDTQRPGLNKVFSQIMEWQNLYYSNLEKVSLKKISKNVPVLNMWEEDYKIFINDTRPCRVQTEIVLAGLSKDIYKECDTVKSKKELLTKFRPAEDVIRILDDLVSKKIVLNIDDNFLNLAVSEKRPSLPGYDDFPGGITYLKKEIKDNIDPFAMSIQDVFGLSAAPEI